MMPNMESKVSIGVDDGDKELVVEGDATMVTIKLTRKNLKKGD